LIGAASELHEAGAAPGAGTFSCTACGSQVSLEAQDDLPECPRCGCENFRRASMFEGAGGALGAVAGPDVEQHTTTEFPVTVEPSAPQWLQEARDALDTPGRYLAFRDDDELQTFALERGWTRIGRSISADIRLDDPTVSRRHALIVWEGQKPLRVLDDRSLNGLLVNGETVDWGRLLDGDELTIGRYQLYLIEV
jgi:predicted  nucleic acid-binding Zn-ribbon protein